MGQAKLSRTRYWGNHCLPQPGISQQRVWGYSRPPPAWPVTQTQSQVTGAETLSSAALWPQEQCETTCIWGLEVAAHGQCLVTSWGSWFISSTWPLGGSVCHVRGFVPSPVISSSGRGLVSISDAAQSAVPESSPSLHVFLRLLPAESPLTHSIMLASLWPHEP